MIKFLDNINKEIFRKRKGKWNVRISFLEIFWSSLVEIDLCLSKVINLISDLKFIKFTWFDLIWKIIKKSIIFVSRKVLGSNKDSWCAFLWLFLLCRGSTIVEPFTRGWTSEIKLSTVNTASYRWFRTFIDKFIFNVKLLLRCSPHIFVNLRSHSNSLACSLIVMIALSHCTSIFVCRSNIFADPSLIMACFLDLFALWDSRHRNAVVIVIVLFAS